MKLESIKLNKFKDAAVKKEQTFMLNGGGTATASGTNYNGTHRGPGGQMQGASYDYGYDVNRGIRNGQTWYTYHNRSNITYAVHY